MEVILCEDVQSLGKIGQVVKVKDGFARNFLIPNGKAYLATAANMKRITKLEEKRKAEHEKQKSEARVFADKLEKVSCTIPVEVNDLEKLYGSVTAQDIAQVLTNEGFEIDKKQVELAKPIEELGIFDVNVKVHPEVTAKVRVWVTKK
ncbi:MAG: 50S ribosomal protein L9 [Candidatus Omnitrophica bacterium]|nr:50S ribosomal protein L9 [Candidatus Omnitrophota bacterium]